MDKFIRRSDSCSSLPAKRTVDDETDEHQFRTAKRKAAVKKNLDKYDNNRELPTQNRFGTLPVDDDSSSTRKSFQEATSAVKKSGHIPPIILEVKQDWTHETITCLVSKFTKRFHLQYRNGKKVAVICYTTDDHQALKNGLRVENAAFMTYSRKDERTPKVVIRGLPNYAKELLPEELEKLGFKGASITLLKSARPNMGICPLFMVQLPAGTDIVQFRKIKYLLNCVITIRKYKPKQSNCTQCFRCQGFGHSARNCNLPARCVKCTGEHHTSECTKKDRSEPAQCCNCNEDHSANHSKCAKRLQYLDRVQQKKIYEHKLREFPRLQRKTLPNPTTDPVINLPADTQKRTIAQVVKNVNIPAPQAPMPAPEVKSDIDDTTSEILDILAAIKKVKHQFSQCSSSIDKVMLVLTQLGRYIS